MIESKVQYFRSLGTNITEVDSQDNKVNYSSVFFSRISSYINEFHLFHTRYNSIPNFLNEIKINCKKANRWFEKNHDNEIYDKHYSKIYFNDANSSQYDDVFYFLYEDLIVNFDSQNSIVRFLFRKTDVKKVEFIINGIKKFKKRSPKRAPRISLLINTQQGIETKSLEITKQRLSVTENYNDDFVDIHNIILKRLLKKNDKGLVLLHGKPGTGKTSYIRYLISTLKKKVIFLPPDMASVITNPSLIAVLIENPNSVLVIEDAENIVVDRERDGSSPVSALLNISDGLLSDCLNIQIICSFNTDISKVDSALMRKGRLIAKYEFKELEVEKARVLSKKIGFNTEINSPMALTAIYNQDEKDFMQNKQRNSIGFMAHSN